MEEYRQKAAFRHYIFKKYSKLLSFDKKQIAIGRIQNFFIKKVLFQVNNLTDEEIKQIPGIFRFRFTVQKIENLNLIRQMFELDRTEASLITDQQIKQIRIQEIDESEAKFLNILFSTSQSIKVLIDVRNYGHMDVDAKWQISLNGELYEIPEVHKLKIKQIYNKTNDHKFLQMIKWSRAMSHSYAKYAQAVGL